MHASTELCDLSATELRARIVSRDVSATELMESTLARIASVNGALNALVTLNPRALDDARDIDRRLESGAEPGLLCGLPVGIKDVTPVAGLRTTYGSTIYADHVAAEDAVVVRRLRDAGAVIVGKTNCPEFAAGASTFNDVFGRTRNPWNLARTSGGSSGGGAAAAAAGMIALAEGTDLGGSLRIPAAFCGIVGLRPSVGLVPTYPTDWLWDTLQVSGPMARTAADVGLMLQAMAGPSEWSPLSQPVAGRNFARAADEQVGQGWRIAYAADPAGVGVDAELERRCRDAAFALSARGAEVEEIDLDLSAGRRAFLTMRGLWFVRHMQRHMKHADRFGDNVRNNVASGLKLDVTALADAEHERNRIWMTMRQLFERFDVIVTPCMAVSPFPVEQNYPERVGGRVMETYVDWFAPTFVFSLTGLPVGSVPCGHNADGLPMGLQIVGPAFGEERVLAVAASVQQDHPIGRPPLGR